MFVAGFVAGIPYMALSIARLISLEMGERMVVAGGQRADVAVMGIEAVIHVTEEAVWTVEPGACADEDAADKPVGPIVAIGLSLIHIYFVIAILITVPNLPCQPCLTPDSKIRFIPE